MSTPAQVAAANGLVNVDAIWAAAQSTGVPFAVACAFAAQESGGASVYGHDPTIFVGAGAVTRANYTQYKAMRDRGGPGKGGMQGVGPFQLTWWSLQDEADAAGGCWDPAVNCLVGCRILARYYAANKSWWATAKQYNGSASYADQVTARIAHWQTLLANTTPGGTVPHTPTGVAAKVIAAAKSQVGYHEGKDANGNWDNIEKYAGQVPGLSWANGQPWCDTFVAWCFLQGGALNLIPVSASVSASEAGWKAKGRWHAYPAVGAQVCYGSTGTHTGLVYDFDANYVFCVEGNTNDNGSAEGDGVYLKQRLRRDPFVAGYGYPAYPEGIISADPAYPKPHPTPLPPSPPPDPLEEIMSYYASKADFEAALQAAAERAVKAHIRDIWEYVTGPADDRETQALRLLHAQHQATLAAGNGPQPASK